MIAPFLVSYNGIDNCGPYGEATNVKMCFEDLNCDYNCPGCAEFAEWDNCEGHEVQQKVVYGDVTTTAIPFNKVEMGGCEYKYFAVYTCSERGMHY